MIRNPIDLNKFNTNGTTDEKFGLFVGTMGGVRFKAALHFSQFCKYNNLKSIYVSAEDQAVSFYDVCLPSCDHIEKYFKSCSVAGGVIQGRTYFEARLCGKPTVEYFIDIYGKIVNIDYEDAPNIEELNHLIKDFDKYNIAKSLISI
jgi:hypothetical protein